MKSTRTYTDFQEFVKNEPVAVQSLIKTWAGNIEGDEDKLMTSVYNWDETKRESFYTDEPITEMSDLIGDLREWGDGTEEVDSCYITETYQLITEDGKFCFEVVGRSYRKDQSVCDEEMDDTVTVTDLEMFEAEKKAKKEEAKNKDKSNWETWFKGKSVEQLQEVLLTFKFPAKLK
jgi:hypothetical protein